MLGGIAGISCCGGGKRGRHGLIMLVCHGKAHQGNQLRKSLEALVAKGPVMRQFNHLQKGCLVTGWGIPEVGAWWES